MVPARGEWTAALRRAAGERGRARRRRLEREVVARPAAERKALIAALLAKK
jgi:hypothetical protein